LAKFISIVGTVAEKEVDKTDSPRAMFEGIGRRMTETHP
jgi:hypothetical protein